MSIVLDLPDDLKSDLDREARVHQLSLPDYIRRLLLSARLPEPAPQTGADLVDYWEREGLIGSRSEPVDPSLHARSLRERAERRGG